MPKEPNDHKNDDKKPTKPPNKIKAASSHDGMDQIQISKQLLNKKSSKVSLQTQRKSNATKIFENFKSMPSLSKLEKMFKDFDDENTEPKNNESKIPVKTNVDNTKNAIFSPHTLQEICKRLTDKLTKITDPSELLDERPRPSVVQPQKKKISKEPYIVGCKDQPQVTKKLTRKSCKGSNDYGLDRDPSELLDELPHPSLVQPQKRKKSKEPYIVGCKDQPQVTKKLTRKSCKGSNDYGLDRTIHSEDDVLPKKRAKKSQIPNVCNSLFNAKTGEISEMLKEKGGDISDSSISSIETVTYDYTNVRLPSFSPIPSTSKDHDTINKNDKMFIESFTVDCTANSIDTQTSLERELDTNDLEIIEGPIETIVIDDHDVLLPKSNYVQQTNENEGNNSVEIIEPAQKLNIGNKSPDVLEVIEINSSYLQFHNTPCYDVIEVIDIDNLIAKRKSMLQKDKNKNLTDNIITVDTSLNANKQHKNPRDLSIVNLTPVVISDSLQIKCCYNMNTARSVNLNTQHNNQLQINGNASLYNQNINPTTIQSISEIDPVLVSLGHDKPQTSTPYNLRNQHPKHNKNITSNNKINTIQPIESPQSNGANSVCPICMDTLRSKNIASTLCGHVFCMACIQKSVNIMGKKCPTCRKKFEGIGYHQIFL